MGGRWPLLLHGTLRESLNSSGSRQLCRKPWSSSPIRPSSPGGSVAFYSLHLHGLALASPLEGYPQNPIFVMGSTWGILGPLFTLRPHPHPTPYTSGAVSPARWSSWAHFQFSRPTEHAASTTKDPVYQGILLPTAPPRCLPQGDKCL